MTIKAILFYAYFFLTFIFLSGCGSLIKPDQTQAPVDFQFVTVKEGDTLRSLAKKYTGSAEYWWRIKQFNNKQLLPGEELIIPLKPYLPGGLTAQGYQLLPVLSYHNFSKGRSRNKLTVAAEDFRTQLNYLKNNGYHVISMAQLNEFINFGQIPEKSVLISIDDGWVSSYKIAYPILKEFGFNATLFISSQYIEEGNKKIISWQQIKEMLSDSTIDIQCHGKTHRDLSVIKEHESFASYIFAVAQDTLKSRQSILDHTGKQVTALAYPFGKTNPLVVDLLKKQGYKTAFTVKRKGNAFFQDPFILNRSMVYATTTLNKFAKDLKYFEKFPVAKLEPIDKLSSLAAIALADPLQYENKQQWRTAYMAWKLRRDKLLSQNQQLTINSLDSLAKRQSLTETIKQARNKVSYIASKLREMAAQQRLSATHTLDQSSAKKRLLQAFLHDPDQQISVNLFYNNMVQLKPVNYIVKENDNFASIAKKLYKDSEKSILVPLFNDHVTYESDLLPGMTLSLPAPPINIKKISRRTSRAKTHSSPMRCSIKLTQPAKQMANEYYTRALEEFEHDHLPEAIKGLKTAICLDPEHDEAVEILDMLQGL